MLCSSASYSFDYPITFVEKKKGKRKINEYLLGLLLLEFINNSDTLEFENVEKGTILEVLRYIENEYAEGTLLKFAERSHYDLHSISREIKRKTGKTFTDLLQEKRLLQAEFLLRTTRMRVSDISVRIGYNNTTYFHRLFENRFGTSPKIYRDSLLN